MNEGLTGKERVELGQRDEVLDEIMEKVEKDVKQGKTDRGKRVQKQK